MDHVEINYRLKRIGKTQVDIARALAISPAVVSNVIHGRITSYRVANYIAGLLDREITTLWPDRYVFKPRTNHPPREE
ncbi:helix-turn-helix domain-containing protein [Rosenbergiella epipactidis]|uniref:helix-turn-helix domain-containing protein n=1 Tax=Rosenbergiella epipactidis TaxID=1544694 RepID=UPI0034DEAB3B